MTPAGLYIGACKGLVVCKGLVLDCMYYIPTGCRVRNRGPGLVIEQ